VPAGLVCCAIVAGRVGRGQRGGSKQGRRKATGQTGEVRTHVGGVGAAMGVSVGMAELLAIDLALIQLINFDLELGQCGGRCVGVSVAVVAAGICGGLGHGQCQRLCGGACVAVSICNSASDVVVCSRGRVEGGHRGAGTHRWPAGAGPTPTKDQVFTSRDELSRASQNHTYRPAGPGLAHTGWTCRAALVCR